MSEIFSTFVPNLAQVLNSVYDLHIHMQNKRIQPWHETTDWNIGTIRDAAST